MTSSPVPIPATSTYFSERLFRLGLGLGLGIGIPLVILFFLLLYFCHRRQLAKIIFNLHSKLQAVPHSSYPKDSLHQLYGDTGATEMGTNAKYWHEAEMPASQQIPEMEVPELLDKAERRKCSIRGGSVETQDTVSGSVARVP